MPCSSCFRIRQIVWRHVITFSCSKHSTISLSPLPLLMRWYARSRAYIDSCCHRRTASIVDRFVCVHEAPVHVLPLPVDSADGERSCRCSGAFSPKTLGESTPLPLDVASILPYTISSLKLQTRRVSSTEPTKREGSDRDSCNMGDVEHRAFFVPPPL